ncbi:serine/threonine protein kinase [Nocardiopsis exhalans]|uniref:Serine/threonine protein kinase n=1 Tax=Nocardiopsis exhalans TaxID=163604 RepID=A0ABY5DID7_9ACTN|nr:serine/threonine-protein kinase [Nocardiopsis exhalans]USY22805.1 serine/threonine protein kinase [Nocardiopsis exhalans]
MSISPDTSLPPGLAPLEAGDPPVIGPYRSVGRIGAGGMGAVYGALDVYESCVAVKTVHADIAREPRFREAFVREVEMLGRADGVSTARLHAADTGAEVPWLAFDYVAGRDLRAHVREFGPLAGGMLRTFSLGMAEGLAALHAAGIAHRDIKPGNVILSPDGPKIVDFGIAVEIGTDCAMDASASYGTPGWTAPERYSGAVADPSADVFAWGGLVTLAATGREPFGKGDAKELARRVKAGEYDVDGVPEDLLGLVRAALSIDPKQRPSSQALVRALMPVSAEETQNQYGRPSAAADSLRGMLRDYWRGVDDAGHDPGRWAAALGVASVVGLGASALSSGVVGAGAMGSGGAAGSGAGAGTAGAGTTAAGSGAVTAGGSAASTATGGMMSGIATSKLGLAGAGVLALAGLAAGGFVVYDQVRVTPGETVAAAVNILEESEGFTAQVAHSFSQAHAEQVAEGTGASVERVMEDSLVEEEYLYSAADQTFLIRGAAMGEGSTAVANHQGDLYVYARGEEGGWPRPEQIEPDPSVGPDSVAVTLVTDPLRALAEMGEAEAVEGQERVYTGPTVFGLLDAGAFVETEASARVELDAEGAPLWAEYTTDEREVRIDFEESDTGVPMEDPQLWALDNNLYWDVVHAPMCGSIVSGWPAQQEWDVQASSWDMDCDQAMDVAGVVADSSGQEDRVVFLFGRFSRGTTRAIDETVACGQGWTLNASEEPNPTEDAAPLLPCRPITNFAEPTEASPEFYDADIVPIILIDFHVRP